MRHKRHFSEGDSQVLLDAIGECRRVCAAAFGQGGDRGAGVSGADRLMGEIDLLADVLTGDRHALSSAAARHLWRRADRTMAEDMPGIKIATGQLREPGKRGAARSLRGRQIPLSHKRHDGRAFDSGRSSPQRAKGIKEWDMRQRQFAALIGFIFLALSPAFAQTTAPTTPAPTPSTPAPAPAGGVAIADWWWVILLVLVAAAAVWYFMRGRTRP